MLRPEALTRSRWQKRVREHGLKKALGDLLDAALREDCNSLCHLQQGSVQEAIKECETRLASSTTRPLEGLPLLIKDNFAQTGQPLGCASQMLQGYVSPMSASCVTQLLAAGALVYARTNMDEFAMGSSGEHSCHGATRNPLDPTRVPGGSSSGSAAALAQNLAVAALGSDTGGSVRQPAACCNLVGFKPSYGRVSRYGLTAFASSLDCVGVLAHSVGDCRQVFQCIAGPDPADPSSLLPQPAPSPAAQRRVGVLIQTLKHCDEATVQAFRAALKSLATAGWELVELKGPDSALALSAYQLLATAEASTNLARYDGVRYGQRSEAGDEGFQQWIAKNRAAGFGPEVRRRILLGTALLARGYAPGYYRRALQARQLLIADYQRLFQQVPLLLSPTMPGIPFRLGERLYEPQQMYRADLLTVGASLAWLPALSLPGPSLEGPFQLGLQLLSNRGNDELLLDAAAEIALLF